MLEITQSQLNKIAQHPLQTWEWGEFRKATGNEILRTHYGQLTLHKLPFTNYKIGMFLKGPEPTAEMLKELKELGEKNNLVFIKFEPAAGFKMENEEEKHRCEHLRSIFIEAGAVQGKPFFTPTTFWIDLSKSEETLLKGFNSKTRYNIRLAERRGVRIEEDNSEGTFDTFITLMQETVERQRFYAHSENYHRKLWMTLHTNMLKKKQKPIARLLKATYEDEVLAVWEMFVWKDILYYPYGASTEKHKNVMAPNLMLWEAIRYGKQHKLKTFDLWGREPGKGFTKFKEGYNPQVVEFLGSWDLITSSLPLYNVYRLAEAGRWGMLRLKSKFTKPSF